WMNFWDSYQKAVGDRWTYLFDVEEEQDFHTHVGAEILIRANGAFKSGYVYDRSWNQELLISKAIETAIALILGKQTLFDWVTDL
ncbi:MAG: hypothetical protein RI564_02465, partial [Gracilimonas sp.]|nr:hypothetical protein [Gracilimonas sp.]